MWLCIWSPEIFWQPFTDRQKTMINSNIYLTKVSTLGDHPFKTLNRQAVGVA